MQPLPEEIRAARSEEKLRDRDLAAKLGITEAQLVAAHVGHGAIRIDAHPDTVMTAAKKLGDVMALTRNEAAVHERDGSYDEYHTGDHAAMVLGPEVDLRMFPKHWKNAFAVERDGMRSLQVFDAAGDAVHKIYLREHSNHDVWPALLAEAAVEDQSQTLAVDPRTPIEAAKSNPGKLDVLEREWRRMTDTHQFLRLVSKLKMNRLGAYRLAGHEFVRALTPNSVDAALHKVKDSGIEVMIFVGNPGCIQIHTGPIGKLTPMGPWQNILDPRFNLHLRLDKIAEVWAVDKPTQRGKVVSLEAFDADGGLILQIFGNSKPGSDSRQDWQKIVETLKSANIEKANS
ncbi:MAG: ChuX/HutX family heme-like substrate-binding protein [Pseudomonadota bacterium]